MTWKLFLPWNPGNSVISGFRRDFCTETTQDSELPVTRAPLLPRVPAVTLKFGTAWAEPSAPAGAGSPNTAVEQQRWRCPHQIRFWLHAWYLKPGGQQSFALFSAGGTSLLRSCRILPGTTGLVSLLLFLLLVEAAEHFLPSSPGLCLHPLLVLLLLSFRGFLKFYFEHQLCFYSIWILPVSDHGTRR